MKTVLNNCYNLGLIDQEQYNMIQQAMQSKCAKVRYDPTLLPNNGQRITWTLTIEAVRQDE